MQMSPGAIFRKELDPIRPKETSPLIILGRRIIGTHLAISLISTIRCFSTTPKRRARSKT